MATSSIFKNIVIEDKKQAERLVRALERAEELSKKGNKHIDRGTKYYGEEEETEIRQTRTSKKEKRIQR